MKKFLIILCFLLSAHIVLADVQYEAYNYNYTATGGATNLELPITVVGSNTLVAIGSSSRGAGSSHNVTDVTIDGSSCIKTNCSLVRKWDIASSQTLEMWIAKGLSATSHTIILYYGELSQVVGGLIAFSGVDQTTPIGTYVEGGPAVSCHSDVTDSVSGDMVFSTATSYDDTLSTTDTQRWSVVLGGGEHTGGAGSTAPGATGTVVMDWSSGSSTCNVIGVSIKKSSGGAPATVVRHMVIQQ